MRRVLPALLVAVAVAGASLAAAGSASAASADCTSANTVDASTQTSADIQTLLSDPAVSVLCLSGDFGVTQGLTVDHSVSLIGLKAATLHYAGAGDFSLLTSSAPSTLTVQTMRFTGARNLTGTGGAIAADAVVVTDSTFDDDQAARGGAIAATDVSISGSSLTDDQAPRGGAVYAVTTSVRGSTFARDAASSDFGGAIVSDGLTVDSSTFDSNSAVTQGGAIIAGDVTVTNSTFINNSVSSSNGFGPTLRVSGGTVQESTFVDNTSVSTTGGESIWASGNTTLTVQGNIFAGANGLTQIAIDAGLAAPRAVDGGGNLFTTAVATEHYFTAAVTSVDPSTRFSADRVGMLGSATLADNGGPVETIALPADSTAIHAVPLTSTVTVDARGVARTAPNDAGSFEYVAPAAVTPPSPSPALAATGANTGWLVWPALALFVIGIAVVLTARRRGMFV